MPSVCEFSTIRAPNPADSDWRADGLARCLSARHSPPRMFSSNVAWTASRTHRGRGRLQLGPSIYSHRARGAVCSSGTASRSGRPWIEHLGGVGAGLASGRPYTDPCSPAARATAPASAASPIRLASRWWRWRSGAPASERTRVPTEPKAKRARTSILRGLGQNRLRVPSRMKQERSPLLARMAQSAAAPLALGLILPNRSEKPDVSSIGTKLVSSPSFVTSAAVT
jgi:hypothetical protein